MTDPRPQQSEAPDSGGLPVEPVIVSLRPADVSAAHPKER